MAVKRTKGPGFAKLQALVKGLDNSQASVGFFDNAKYEDGTSVAYVATIQEFGVPEKNIPPRPFMRPTVAAQLEGWKKFIASSLKNGVSVENILNAVGSNAVGEIQKSITAVTTPVLKASTIKGRKNKTDKPLIDTQVMINSVSYKVESKD